MNKFNREELVQTLFEESHDGLFFFDPETERLLDVNPAAQRMTGFTRKEMLSFAVTYWFRSEVPGRLNALWQAFRKTGALQSEDGILLRTREEGLWIPLNVSVTRLHVRPKTLGLITARDIRERRETHAQLKKVEGQLSQVLASIEDCIWSLELDAQGRVHSSYTSPVIETLTGQPPAFFHAGLQSWSAIIREKDRPPVAQGLAELAAGQMRQGDFEYRIQCPDGSLRWLRNRVRATHEGSGLVRLDGVASDITARKRSDEARQASEARYRSLTENLEQGIFLKDQALRYVAANRHFCSSLGLTEAELIGRTDHDLYAPERAAGYEAADRRVLAEGHRLEVEEQIADPAKPRTVRIVKTPVKDGQGQHAGVLGIIWDVTEQRELEAQLRQAMKMEAIGQLAGGVAHDFNNLLTVILGNVALLQGEGTGGSAAPAPSAPGPDTAGLLEAIRKAARQAASLTSKLLGFSRQTALQLEKVNLHRCAEEAVALLRRTIDPRITLVVRADGDVWPVRADPVQMNQVLMNLCINSRDAMPDGGRLLVETTNVHLDEEYARLHVEAHAGEFVRLRVEDTGQGIPPEIRQRIFDPFFTTKGPGHGTGLGLAMVFGIVKQHDGWINCYSEVGQGTRFDIYLPRDPAGQAAQPAGKAAGEPRSNDPARWRGTETILLADDEPLIRRLGRAILESYGYRILDAEDGHQAVETFQQHRNEIDLVILDLTMPRLSGREALRQLRQLDPEVRVLLASGYSAEQLSQEEQASVYGFVGKPYHPGELARSVRAALDRAPEGSACRAG